MTELRVRSAPEPSAPNAAMRPPDFFLVGVPRCGTTFLYHHLRVHPGVFAPRLKEACFTCAGLDPGVGRGSTFWIHDAARYFALFAAARGDQLVGEGCTYNIYWPAAPERIQELNPAARILVVLRDPIEQMRSAHALKVLTGDMPWDDFGHAIRAQARMRLGRPGLPRSFADYDLRDKATVSAGLAGFMATFGRERVHVIAADEMAADPATVYRDTSQFLGIDASFVPDFQIMMPNRRARSRLLCRTMASRQTIARAKRVVPRPLRPLARLAALTLFGANRRAVAREELDQGLLDELRQEFRPEAERISELVGQDMLARWWGTMPARVATSEENRVPRPGGRDV